MAKTYQLQVLGWPLRADVTWLDDGVDIGLYGGVRIHVGSVILTGPMTETLALDQGSSLTASVARRWASMLRLHFGCPVCIRCGIDYPCLDEAGERELRNACENLMLIVMNQEGISDGCP